MIKSKLRIKSRSCHVTIYITKRKDPILKCNRTVSIYNYYVSILFVRTVGQLDLDESNLDIIFNQRASESKAYRCCHWSLFI